MIEHKKFFKTPKKDQITKKLGKEIVVLHTLNETFTAQQCDYCLDLTKVLFET